MKRLNIQVLGFGCQKCKILAENAEKALKDLGLDYNIKIFLKLEDIMHFGVTLAIPALAIDGKIIMSGQVGSVNEIKRIIQKNVFPSGSFIGTDN